MKKLIIVFLLLLTSLSLLAFTPPSQTEYQSASKSVISGVFSIESAATPNRFLRMDPTGVPAQGGKSGGTVNVQNRTGSLEKFRINHLGEGIYSIELASRPGYYLRMDPRGVTQARGRGAGVVNVQNRVGSMERFRINQAGPGKFTIESAATPGRYLRISAAGIPSQGGDGGGKVNVNDRTGAMEEFRFVRQGRMSGMYSIESTTISGRYLRMDPNGVPTSGGSGGGTVNVQNRIRSLEKFTFNYLGNGNYSIESTAQPGRYLRMDPRGVNEVGGHGAGVVNVQNRVGNFEKFNLVLIEGDIYSIESAAKANRYLRVESNNVPASGGDGGGYVNVQNVIGPAERFHLVKLN